MSFSVFVCFIGCRVLFFGEGGGGGGAEDKVNEFETMVQLLL